MYVPSLELKEWVKLLSDGTLGLAAIVTAVTAVYGVRMWKHELAGREIYSAVKELVRESHLYLRAMGRLRRLVQDYEREAVSAEVIAHTTEGERWRASEIQAFRKRVDNFAEAEDRYRSALLEARVLIGSKVFVAFQPFSECGGEVIDRVNNYLDLLKTCSVMPDSQKVKKAQEALYESNNADDDLSQKIADSRENGEKALLSFLNRKSIRG